MTEPRLTVITIGRNAIDDLKLTRASVAAQSYRNVHHLLIDGASTDGTIELLRSWGEQDRVSWLSEHDSGIYDAMNKALGHVDDGYLMYLHAGDTFVDTDAAARAMDAISTASEPPDLAIGWSRFVSNGAALPFVVGGATPKALTSAHESTVFSYEFHRHERYNTERKLGADYEFFRMLAGRADLKVLRLPFTISNFVFGGRSNDPSYDRVRFRERARIDATFGDEQTVLTNLRSAVRIAIRRVVYATLGAHRAAQFFLRLACRRGNSGARRLPVGQIQVDFGASPAG